MSRSLPHLKVAKRVQKATQCLNNIVVRQEVLAEGSVVSVRSVIQK
jgi:hypothetical protein